MPSLADFFAQLQDPYKYVYMLMVGMLSMILVATPVWAAGVKFVDSGFETGEYESYGWVVSGNKAQIVSAPEPICQGKHAVKIALDRYQNDTPFRTELMLTGKEGGELAYLEYEQEYWLGLSIFLPPNWKPDYKSTDIMAQLHGVPDLELGEGYRNPLMTLHVKGDKWYLTTIRDSRNVTPTDPANKKYEEVGGLSLGEIKTGGWTNFVIHFVLSYQPGNGQIDVWKNDVKVVDNKKLGVGFNDKRGPYWKIGNYKPRWKPVLAWKDAKNIKRRIHYVDEIRLAKGPNRYNDVAGNCGEPRQPPLDDKPVKPDPSNNQPATPVIKNIIIRQQ